MKHWKKLCLCVDEWVNSAPQLPPPVYLCGEASDNVELVLPRWLQRATAGLRTKYIAAVGRTHELCGPI